MEKVMYKQTDCGERGSNLQIFSLTLSPQVSCKSFWFKAAATKGLADLNLLLHGKFWTCSFIIIIDINHSIIVVWSWGWRLLLNYWVLIKH